MIIYPAMDLRKGRCVRLFQGDFRKETVYEEHPLTRIYDYAQAGATWIHIVDLDGAQDPCNQQHELLADILQGPPIKIQLGGGIRTVEQARKLFKLGVDRIIIGSLAIKDRDTTLALFDEFGPDKIVLAFDVRYNQTQQPIVTTDAWQTLAPVTLTELIDSYLPVQFQHLLCTDISKDGTLSGPNLALYSMLKNTYPQLHIQASGGIKSLENLKQLRALDIAGAIIGRSLYEKAFALTEALTC